MSKYVGLKSLLQEGLSEPEFYSDLSYKFRKIVGKTDFSIQFKKDYCSLQEDRYNLDILWQTACMVVNPIVIDNFASHFNCTMVSRSSD